MNPIRFRSKFPFVLCALIVLNTFVAAQDAVKLYAGKACSYTIVDTGQEKFYNDTKVMAAPKPGEAFYGQDATYRRNWPSYTNNGDGTISDKVTGLMWQQSFDHNGDGRINVYDKLTYEELLKLLESGVEFAGYTDWRLPTIKEIYSLILFSGEDIVPNKASAKNLIPFIDNKTFDFGYGDLNAGERLIDMQCATSTVYVSAEMPKTVFGVNFADGRIKGYQLTLPHRGDKKFSCLLVRGNVDYGKNTFIANGNGTISDHATGLMWMQNDSKEGMLWKEALAYAENMEFAGHSDWRLPDAKELQSIVDYTRSPASSNSAAINTIFNCTQIENEAGERDFPYYWSSTTHVSQRGGQRAVYVAFGRSLGKMRAWIDVHGAGSQRSDPKTGNPENFADGRGPQGDAIRIYNHVRLVRSMK